MTLASIKCENLKVVRAGQVVLEEITFTLPTNSLTIVFGPNAAGKTTLLRVLCGLEEPSSGTVEVFDQKPYQALDRIGYVPQLAKFDKRFPVTTREAVLMGLSNVQTDERLLETTLNQVSLLEKQHLFVRDLSGGELQRMLLARALIKQPKLLLLDEVSSGIDIGVKGSLLTLLSELKDKMTILFVTHDMSVISRSVDLVLCLNRKMVSHGRPEEALSDEALKCMYGGEATIFSHCTTPHAHVHKHD